MAEKLKADGKSDKEIKEILLKIKKQWQADRYRGEKMVKMDADKRRILEEKKKKLYLKLKEAGKSDKEIKQALMDFDTKVGLMPPPKKMDDSAKVWEAKEKKLIEKMIQAGKSKAEIKQAIMELREKRKQWEKENAKKAQMIKKKEMMKKKEASKKASR